MLGVGIFLCLVMFTAAGYLTYRNSKLIAERQKEDFVPLPSTEYTVFIGKQKPDPELDGMLPLWVMSWESSDSITLAGLCRVTDGDQGDLRLEEAERVLSSHINKALQSGTYLSCEICNPSKLHEYEHSMAVRLSTAAGPNRSV
ncbi:hypothetical protein HII30_12030 [Paenibacillus lemnae]|uniref:Uncharacterized protein n=2 Tax=Paenibacillus lemnae TaxID=1330551 RepID=A0A848M8H9_PAELE|nr:hypothetical protein [Paenibacillus lemnae]